MYDFKAFLLIIIFSYIIPIPSRQKPKNKTNIAIIRVSSFISKNLIKLMRYLASAIEGKNLDNELKSNYMSSCRPLKRMTKHP